MSTRIERVCAAAYAAARARLLPLGWREVENWQYEGPALVAPDGRTALSSHLARWWGLNPARYAGPWDPDIGSTGDPGPSHIWGWTPAPEWWAEVWAAAEASVGTAPEPKPAPPRVAPPATEDETSRRRAAWRAVERAAWVAAEAARLRGDRAEMVAQAALARTAAGHATPPDRLAVAIGMATAAMPPEVGPTLAEYRRLGQGITDAQAAAARRTAEPAAEEERRRRKAAARARRDAERDRAQAAQRAECEARAREALPIGSRHWVRPSRAGVVHDSVMVDIYTVELVSPTVLWDNTRIEIVAHGGDRIGYATARGRILSKEDLAAEEAAKKLEQAAAYADDRGHLPAGRVWADGVEVQATWVYPGDRRHPPVWWDAEGEPHLASVLVEHDEHGCEVYGEGRAPRHMWWLEHGERR